jgi:hypothetical protein
VPIVTNPYVLIAIVLFYASSLGIVGWKAFDLGQANIIAEQALIEKTERTTREIAMEAAAEQIATLRPQHQTINRKVETITREVPIYRDCVSSPDIERMLDDARAGRFTVPPVDNRVVPEAGRGAAP